MVVICEETLKNVKEERGSSMKSILIWLMRQLRLLNKDEIAAAVGLAEAGLVTEICSKALVEQWSQSVTVGGQVQALEVSRFTHFSAKDYLETVQLGSPESQKPETARFVFSSEDVNLEMTSRCLEILTACSLDHTAEDDAESDAKKIGSPLPAARGRILVPALQADRQRKDIKGRSRGTRRRCLLTSPIPQS